MLIFDPKSHQHDFNLSKKKLHNRTDARHTASRLLARAASEDKTWCSIVQCAWQS